MNLTERIERQKDRREAEVRPIVERRIPEWRRRALEQQERLGNVAVVDLTGRAA